MLLYKIRCKYLYIFTFQKISNCLQKKLCDVSDSEDENDEILVVKSSFFRKGGSDWKIVQCVVKLLRCELKPC